MKERAQEQRAAVMILVEASWQDQSGTTHKSRACILNRSGGGACIRLRKPVPVGSKLLVQWRWEQFTGISRYCRSEGKDYFVGIERDPDEESSEPPSVEQRVRTARVPEKTIAPKILPQEQLAKAIEKGYVEPETSALAKAAAANGAVQVRQEPRSSETRRQPESVSSGESSLSPAEYLLKALEAIDPWHDTPKAEEFAVPQVTEQQERPKHPGEREASKEKKHMTRKWFDVGQKEEANGSVGAPANANGADPAQGSAHNYPEKRFIARDSEDASSSIELLSMADIYQSAGILSPRKGYSILKVVEMLGSEHLHGLPKEMKRTTVLVALDAAGITLEEVAQDAKSRIDAIDSYEDEQRKQFETLLARKAEENQQIMAELERIKASYAERMRRNLEGVAREKATFGNWLTTKQTESQNIREALELCVKNDTAERAASAGDNGLMGSRINVRT
jgi:hypothetical protein